MKSPLPRFLFILIYIYYNIHRDKTQEKIKAIQPQHKWLGSNGLNELIFHVIRQDSRPIVPVFLRRNS